MNQKEKAVIALLRKNPFLTQQEMADMLNMSRPALANLISGLMKRGVIEGRAYVLAKVNEIVCIGGANVDRKFHLKEDTQLGTSNPTSMSVSVGGVARNIAENLGRLDHSVRLLTVAGHDQDWQVIEKASKEFIDVSAVGHLPDAATGSYSAVLDQTGELVIALANMDIYDSLSVSYIEENDPLIANAALVVIDLNCAKETVEYVKSRAQLHGTQLAIIPVSSPKMSHLPDDLEGVTWFICNKDEAETYTGQTIQDDEDWQRAVRQILETGAENVIVTGGARGAMVGNQTAGIQHFPGMQNVKVEDVTGAGDAFVSGVLHGHLLGMDTEEVIHCGMLNATKTLGSPYTVRLELSKEQFEIEMEELK